MVAIIDVVHTSRVHKQSYASVLLEMDPTVCPTTITNTTTVIDLEFLYANSKCYLETSIIVIIDE